MTLNIFSINGKAHECLELKTRADMTVWIAEHHAPAPDGGGAHELVFSPFELPKDSPILISNDMHAYAMAAAGWFHARLYNVAINVDRYLMYTERTNKEGIARLLPFHMCLQNGSLASSQVKNPLPLPSLTRTKPLSPSAVKMYRNNARLLRSLHSSHEWQLLPESDHFCQTLATTSMVVA